MTQEQLDQLTDAVMEMPSPERAIPELFALVKRLPHSDFGAPGPIVHTLERMDYTEELIASIRRRPTRLAVHMVNRILNARLSPERRKFFLELLAFAATHPNADESAQDAAEHYIEFQSTKRS
jgi:truncated hemoglobin YjbI